MRIIRCKTTLEKTGDTRSPLYDKVKKGLFTTPIKLGGGRASGWPEHEVNAIIVARIRGDCDDAIRKLVDRLHDQRKTLSVEELSA